MAVTAPLHPIMVIKISADFAKCFWGRRTKLSPLRNYFSEGGKVKFLVLKVGQVYTILSPCKLFVFYFFIIIISKMYSIKMITIHCCQEYGSGKDSNCLSHEAKTCKENSRQ
jgi:hypothetical protein